MGTPSDILRRKADAAREDRETRVMSPRRALRRALNSAAELGLDLPLRVNGVEEAVMDRDTLLSELSDGGLIVSLDSEGAPPGVITMDMQLLCALIEVQTLGRVFEANAADRAVTRTDAAVAMPLIDGTLRGFDQLLQEHTGGAPLAGYHFGHWVKDMRTLQASLPDGEYTRFQLTATLGHSERTGAMVLALPVLPDPVEPAPEEEKPRARLRDEVLEAPARLDTILHRLEMTLDEVSALQAGDVLTLPLRCLGEVRLHVGDRQTIASGTLGQLGGNRAVRLSGFGNPRLTGSVQGLDSLPNMQSVDLADAGLLEPKRHHKPAQGNPLPPPDVAPAQGAAINPAKDRPPPTPTPAVASPARDDPTGTEALLSELGLSDLGDEGDMSLSLGALPSEDGASGSFMTDLPAPTGDG